ncbi:hypothetical protein HY449_01325 [Candidatus Pacearchaeota archaeon]|nr:hypothetical protein [Candidatus Pacearchaeota archaeon]
MNPWTIGSVGLLVIWIFIFLAAKRIRKEMLWASVVTLPLGLTEPLFVPEYWNPPSLLNLAAKTGFDIESFIFAFVIGGIAAVSYESFFRTKHKKMSAHEMRGKRHRFHLLALFSPVIIFLLLYLFTNLNPIYSAIISLFIGGIVTILCRPDLKKKILTGGLLFLGFYFAFFLLINFISPGWVEKIWNLSEISGILILGIPMEELLFAFSVGMMWSGIYEHIKWHKSA